MGYLGFTQALCVTLGCMCCITECVMFGMCAMAINLHFNSCYDVTLGLMCSMVCFHVGGYGV